MENDKNKSNVPFVKSSYYPGKLLHASDFIREQEYGNRKLEFINRKFHGWGIIEGLEIRIGKDGSLHLMQGSAIDPCGRIIVVPGHRRVGHMRSKDLIRKRQRISFLEFNMRRGPWRWSRLFWRRRNAASRHRSWKPIR